MIGKVDFQTRHTTLLRCFKVSMYRAEFTVDPTRNSVTYTCLASQNTVKRSFFRRGLGFKLLGLRGTVVPVFHALSFLFWVVRMHPRFVSCHNIEKKVISLFTITLENPFTTFLPLLFVLFCEFAWHPSRTDFTVTQLFDNASNPFLRYIHLSADTFLRAATVALNQFVDLLLMLCISHRNRTTTARFILNVRFTSFRYTKFYGPPIHSSTVNSFITVNEFQTTINVTRVNIFCCQEFNHCTLF